MNIVKENYNFAKNKLYPICRSITGNGIKKSLYLIKKKFPKLKIIKVKSNTYAYDWKIPPEWNIYDAYVLDEGKKKIIDFKKNNLHLVSFSKKINKTVTKKELFKHLHYLKDQKNAIPYVTSYYKKYWGFCVTYNEMKKINNSCKNDEKFRVVINSKFKNNGHLNYGELILKGKSEKEILISTYLCHPSMANNELSGPIVSMSLIKYFQKKKLDKTIRFVFIPETIGSIVFLSKNLKQLKKKVIGGYNLTCIGDERNHSCMMTKYKNSQSDKALKKAYRRLRIKYKIYSFLERGSDERQYNSPGIDLPIASIFRTKYGEYKEYHTSKDDFNFVTQKGINGGFNVAKNAVINLLKIKLPISNILCEPQLSKRNMYEKITQINYRKKNKKLSKQYLNFLQYSDGKNNLEEISNLINLNKKTVKKIYKILIK